MGKSKPIEHAWEMDARMGIVCSCRTTYPHEADLKAQLATATARLAAVEQERADWKKRALAQLQTCFAHQEKYEELEQEREEWKQRYDSGEGAYRLACDAQKQALAQRDVALRLQREQRYAMEAAEQQRAQAVAEGALMRVALERILRDAEGSGQNWIAAGARVALDAAPLAAEHLAADRKRDAVVEAALAWRDATREGEIWKGHELVATSNALYAAVDAFLLAPPQARAAQDEECAIHSWSMDPSDPCRHCGATQQQARAEGQEGAE